MINKLITLVRNVSYRKNVILVEFNKNMNININTVDIEHSYLNFKNYAIENQKDLKVFPRETKVNEVEFNFSARFKLPNSFSENIYDNAILHLGYVGRKKIFYIQTANEEILDLCNSVSIGEEIEELNLENGDIEIINNRALKYYYTGENKFEEISIRDFYILKEQRRYSPISIEQVNSKEFILIFSNSILNKSEKSIFLKVIEKPTSRDIFGFDIKGDIKIPIVTLNPTILNSFSFLNYENRIAYFKLNFSKPIKIFDSTDFIAKYNNSINKTINYLGINDERKTIDIAISNLDIDDIDNVTFQIFTSVKPNDVNTIDENGKIIYIEKKKASLFKSININWTLKDYNFSKSIIKIEFNDLISPNSLIKDFSVFESNINIWNGERVAIKSDNLILGYDDNKILTLNLNKNESLGKIVINSKTNFNIIASKKIFNKYPCYIYIQNNKLFLEFNEKEDMDGILVFIEDFKYVPYPRIKSKDENFIFHGYAPSGKYNLENIVYIEPLKNSQDNPFKGGKTFKNYILVIHKNNKFRDYGDILNRTEINGFLRMVGRLENNEMVKLQNLKVLGDIIIDVSKINAIFENVECLETAKIKIQ